MKERLTVEDTALTATLVDSETTRDFVSLLPLPPGLNRPVEMLRSDLTQCTRRNSFRLW
jgi:hypothetical protein